MSQDAPPERASAPAKQPSARLFVALEPPQHVRDAIVSWQAGEGADEALRAVAPQALHFTLCFLGSRPEAEIEPIAALLGPDLAASVEISLQPEPVALPAKRPRLFAIGAESPSAAVLQGELARRLAAAGFYEPEKRPFWPHLTAFRVRSQPRSKGRPRSVEAPPKPLPEALLSPFHAVRIALYRSYLRSSGSHYVSLASLELPPPARSGANKR